MNALIYARVSSKEQEKEGYSIPSQLKLLRNYASKENLIVFKEFEDIETAKKAGRTNFNEMVKSIKENENIKHLLVEKTDRLLRNIKDYSIIDELMEYYKLTVHLVKENEILSRDSRSHQKFIFGIKALMAKNYVDNLSEETKKGMLEKAEQGIYPSFAPIGYKNVKNEAGKTTIVQDPDNALLIKQIFELYATGDYSLNTLRKEIIEQGFIYRNGKNFYKGTLEKILKNEFYTGVFLWKGKKYENAKHKPIIDLELFHKVQEMLLNPFKQKSRKGLFSYTNLIQCGYCSGSLTAEIKKEKYIYYRCSQDGSNHNQKYIREHDIEQQFADLLKKIQLTEKQKRAILQGLKEIHEDKVDYHNTSIKRLNTHIITLQTRIDNMYTDKLDGKISEDYWASNHYKWQQEKDKAIVKVQALEKADKNFFESADLILELARKAYELFLKQPPEQKRKLINLITSECVFKNNKLHIKLRAPFDKVLLSRKTRNWLPRQDSNLWPSD